MVIAHSLFSSYEERMVEDYIRICGFFEDGKSKKRKVSTLFEDRTCIKDKSARRGPILFEHLVL